MHHTPTNYAGVQENNKPQTTHNSRAPSILKDRKDNKPREPGHINIQEGKSSKYKYSKSKNQTQSTKNYKQIFPP